MDKNAKTKTEYGFTPEMNKVADFMSMIDNNDGELFSSKSIFSGFELGFLRETLASLMWRLAVAQIPEFDRTKNWIIKNTERKITLETEPTESDLKKMSLPELFEALRRRTE